MRSDDADEASQPVQRLEHRRDECGVGAVAWENLADCGFNPADQFLGFLPRGETALAAVWSELRAWPFAAVAFESPQRLPGTLRSLAHADPERHVAVCRELTKVHEEIVRGTATEAAARFSEPPRGEITLVIGPGEPLMPDVDEAVAAVAELLAVGVPRRRAAEIVARLTGASRNELYRRTL